MFSTSFLTSFNNISQREPAEKEEFNFTATFENEIEKCFQSPEEILKMIQSISATSNEIQQRVHTAKEKVEELPDAILRECMLKQDRLKRVQSDSDKLMREALLLQDEMKTVVNEASTLKAYRDRKQHADSVRSQIIDGYETTKYEVNKNLKVLSELNG